MNGNTTDVTATELEIAAKEQAIATLQDEIRALRKQAEADAVQADLAGIAEQLGTDPERVAAFLATVAERSGYGLSYLTSVVTGNHRVRTPGSRYWE